MKSIGLNSSFDQQLAMSYHSYFNLHVIVFPVLIWIRPQPFSNCRYSWEKFSFHRFTINLWKIVEKGWISEVRGFLTKSKSIWWQNILVIAYLFTPHSCFRSSNSFLYFICYFYSSCFEYSIGVIAILLLPAWKYWKQFEKRLILNQNFKIWCKIIYILYILQVKFYLCTASTNYFPQIQPRHHIRNPNT